MALDVVPSLGRTRPRSGLRDHPHGERLLVSITAGVLVGVIQVMAAVSVASLIFTGSLSAYLSSGVGLALFGGIVIMSVTALMTSGRGVIGGVQDTTAAILALIGAGVAAHLAPGDPRTFSTVVVALGVATAAMGVCFLFLGAFRLGNLVRYLPYPVVGGFLAGTGWLLARGGIEVLTGTAMSSSTVQRFFQAATAVRWWPGVVLAVVLLFLRRRSKSQIAVPATLVGATMVFYVVAALSGSSLGHVQQSGWVLGPFPTAGLWQPWALSGLGDADWGAVGSQLPNIATLLALGTVALLLNATGVEDLTGEDLDLNQELRSAAVANILAGAGGAPGGFPSLSLTTLGRQMAGASRVVAVVAAGLCAGVLVFGAALVAGLPKLVVGGLILSLGLGFLVEWLVDARARLSRVDHAVVVLILAVVVGAGFLQGVAVGLAAAVVLFVLHYGRIDAVKHTLSGTNYVSHVDRGPEERRILREQGDAIAILELQGFIFFGTARRIHDRIRERIDHPDRTPLRFVVLDLRAVPAMDGSAVMGFTRIREFARRRGVEMVVTASRPRVTEQLTRGGLLALNGDGVQVFGDVDVGVQWCEDHVLGPRTALAQGGAKPLLEHLRQALGGDADPGVLTPRLERLEFPAGTQLLRQGELTQDVYFLESGWLTVTLDTKSGPMRLRTMAPGVVVGEAALYLGTPRTASVVSETAVTVYRFSREALREIERDHPQLAVAIHNYFGRLLAERLADSLRTVQDLRT